MRSRRKRGQQERLNGFPLVNGLRVTLRARTCAPFRWLTPHPLWLSSRPYASELHASHLARPTSSPAMASAVAASTAARFLPQLGASWLRRARVALLPSPLPWRPLAVTVAAASRRPRDGEGGGRGRTRRRRARGAEQEEGVSLSSGEPLPRLLLLAAQSFPSARGANFGWSIRNARLLLEKSRTL